MKPKKRRGNRDAEKLGDLIKPMLKQLKVIGRRVGRDLHEAWLEVAGPDLSRRTRLSSFRSGQVVVDVDSAALLHELQNFRRGDLLARLRERLPRPHISELRFRLGAFGYRDC